MNVHDIILEDKRLDEKPTSSIGNFAKKMASKVTTGGMSARLGGSAEMGSKANQIYKDLARWQGINSKTDKNMTAQDLAAFMKQHKLNAGGIDLPDGVLGKKTIDAVLKKAAANDLTGGNAAVSKEPAPAGKGGVQGALGALAKGAGVKTPNVKSTTTSTSSSGGGSGGGDTTTTTNVNVQQPAGGQAQGGASKTADPKVTPLKTKGGITPDVQAMLDKLTPTEKKALAGAI
tara:strand:+ start:140 stop:835 length:696 start_codon:yes stop_codon:yes gene_type:complete